MNVFDCIVQKHTQRQNLGHVLINGVPLLLVDRQMALVRNSDIHCTGSTIVYMQIIDCLGN